jgi:hypothetical protein
MGGRLSVVSFAERGVLGAIPTSGCQTGAAMIVNVHPVDELFRIRAQIKNLQEREGQLREELLSGRCGL